MLLLDSFESTQELCTIFHLSPLRRDLGLLDLVHVLLSPLKPPLQLLNLCLPLFPCQPRLLLHLSIVSFDSFVCFSCIGQLQVLECLPEALIQLKGALLLLYPFILPINLGLHREFHPVEL